MSYLKYPNESRSSEWFLGEHYSFQLCFEGFMFLEHLVIPENWFMTMQENSSF